MRTGKNVYEILAGLDAVQLATVIAGWATLAAAIFAAGAAYFAGLAWKRQERFDDRVLQTEERAQSALVSAWLDIREIDIKDLPREDRESASSATGTTQQGVRVTRRYMGMVKRWHLIIRNASDAPIYGLAMEFWYRNGKIDSVGLDAAPLIPPDDNGVAGYLKKATTDDLKARLRDGDSLSAVTVAFTFRDAAGIWWLRDHNGVLSRTTEPSPPSEASGKSNPAPG